MDFALLIYLISVLAGLNDLFEFGLLLGGIAVIGSLIGMCIVEFDERAMPSLKRMLKFGAVVFFVSVPLGILMPSKGTMYAMVAAYTGQSVLESETVGRLAPKSLQILEQYMDEFLVEKKKE